MALERIVVVGGSLAGLRAVETLRREGYEGSLVVLGDEPHRPYDRPPLSKQILSGEWEAEKTALPGSAEDHGAEWKLGARAVGLDPAAREVVLGSGERIGFDGLLIATGARVRELPGTPPLEGIHGLRTLDDALAVRGALERGPRVCVVGAGFIGAEVAASCRARGLDVSLVEALPVPLGRVLGDRTGGHMARLHRDHGVDLRCGVGVEGFEGGARVEAVRLSDGTRIPADLVVVGVGVRPNTEWLAGAGLDLDDGVACDATCATAIPGVYAAGDVARWENPLYGVSMRVEHWTHAVEQGIAAAENLLAGEGAKPFASVPFFWSDQYDTKIQMAGRPLPTDDVRVAHGREGDARFVVLYGRAGRLVAALGFNRARFVVQYRNAIRDGARFDEIVAKAGA
ncbi:MAG TPA: FAD-dependent oxidoreductase [Myxococcota bacterium]|nr:FAD-dependent oxidoreductase [Myxococcota bacterium]